MSSPGADDVCPICLCPIEEEFSRPENCKHRFDLDCLTEWAKLRLSCPSCRANFGAIYTYKILEGKPTLHKVQKMEQPTQVEPFDEANPLDFTVCEICSGGMHEELLLICDQCDRGFHTYCLNPPLDAVPTSEQWFCPQCEESRMNQPSTSRRSEPSARAIRLVQRTALAERVRRMLARNRRVVEIIESSTEEEEEQGGDDEEEEEEEEEEDSVASSEEEARDFFDDDARVLGEIAYDIPRGEVPLPTVRRRSKKERTASKKTSKAAGKRKKVTKRRTKGKRRKVKRRCSKRTSSAHANAKEGPMDAFVLRRGVARDPIARLSLLGAGLEPVADEDPLVTENSRRFDRPIVRRREESLSVTKDEPEEKKVAVDTCDLLGSIIPEQMKTLAPGRLFAVRGGRFNTTEDFEKYKARTTNQMSNELKERLGIPVEKTASEEEPSKRSGIQETSKVNSDVSKKEHHSARDGDTALPPLFKKPESKDAIRCRENSKNRTNDDSRLGRDSKRVEGLLPGQKPDLHMKRIIDERPSSSYRRYEDHRDRVVHDRRTGEQHYSDVQKAEQPGRPSSSYRRYEDHRDRVVHDRRTGERHHSDVQKAEQPGKRRSDEKVFAANGHHPDNDHDRAMRHKNAGESSHSEANRSPLHASDQRSFTTARHVHHSHQNMPHDKAERSSAQRPRPPEKVDSLEKISTSKIDVRHREDDRDRVLGRSRNEERRAPSGSRFNSDNQSTDERTSESSRIEKRNQYDRLHYHGRNDIRSSVSEVKRDESDKRRHLTDRKHHPNHLPRSSDSSVSVNSERKLRFEESEREDRGHDAKFVLEQKPALEQSGSANNDWMPNLQATSTVLPVPATGSDQGVKSVAGRKMTSDELLSTIEGFAKEGIKVYKKRLTREEYKDVMRAVVRECYKKRILDESRIKEKVKKYVRAVKSGESLPSGNHGVKRREGNGGDEVPAPPKRPRVEIS